MLSSIKVHWVCITAIIILILISGFLIYKWIDVIVWLDDVQQENRYKQEETAVLQKLLLETGTRMTREEITQLVMEHFGKDLIKQEEQNELSVQSVVLVFRGDSLVEVKSYGEKWGSHLEKMDTEAGF